VAGTYDRSDIIVYKNGNLVDSVPETAALPDGGSNPSAVGRYEWDNTRYMTGKIFALMYYSRALTQEEIMYNMLNYANPVHQGDLIGWWIMEAGTGTAVEDRSGTGNNGTMHNFTDPYGWVDEKMWRMREEVGL